MDAEFRADPNRPSYQGSNRPLDPLRCKAGVWSNERWSTYAQCSRKATLDGWCSQHHPEAKAAREAAADAKYKETLRRSAMGSYGERFMRALIKIRDGDNDARTTAAEALKFCAYANEPASPPEGDAQPQSERTPNA